MRLERIRREPAYLADFERHEALFLGRDGREFRFFFLVPHSCSAWLGEGADHWFLLGATSAALLGEDYHQDEPVSALLKRHVECLVLQWKEWFPGARKVALHVPVIADGDGAAADAGKLNGLYFTGGVDSTFTLATIGARTDVLVRAIFDWDDERDLVRQLREQPRHMFGKQHVCIGTNVLRAFPEFEDAWAYRTHGPALGALAHLLSGRLGRMVFSSSRMYGTLIPWGSHPLTDPLLSSAGLAFEHFGTEYSRLDKTRAIASARAYLSTLEVCGQIPSIKGVRLNCSCCNKCLRTMIALDVAGAPPDAARSFDWSHYGPARIARMRLYHPNEYAVFRELQEDARAGGRPELAAAIGTAIRKSYKFYPLGAVEGFLRRRFPTLTALLPMLKGVKHALLKPRAART